ncbi:MAG: hypothetical protein KatS3mg060_2878 [Dehalococcoidia bacterium]|nr:MAG: hypothetical protein KatS3mg060_2878 [Dehalococcoidia bacterium]
MGTTPTWRQLVAQLAEAGIGRRAHDTKADLLRRLAAVHERPVPPEPEARLVMLIEGRPAAIDRVAKGLAPEEGWRLGPTALAVPAEQWAAVRRRVHRRGVGVAGEPVAPVVGTRAAVAFVQQLAARLGWPAAALPASWRPVRLSTRDRGFLSSWNALLDRAWEGDDARSTLAPALPAPPDPTVRERLQAAIADGRPVEILYRSLRTGTRTRRWVQPTALVSHAGREALHAFCYWRNERRVFWLAGIESCWFHQATTSEPAGSFDASS